MANEFKIRKGLIVHGSGSTILDVRNDTNSIFSFTDSLTGTLLSVGDTSGIPIFTVGSDDSAKLGKFNFEAIKVTGSNAFITGSIFGTASYALTAAESTPTAAGSTGQLQYNSASVFAGTTELFITGGLLALTSSAEPPVAPSSSVLITAKSMANRMLPHFNGPSNLDTTMQPALFGNTILIALPNFGSTTPISIGNNWSFLAAGSGEKINGTLTSTSDISGMTRNTYATGTTEVSAAGFRSGNVQAFLGNAEGRGGFFFYSRFGVETSSGTYRVAVGLMGGSTAITADPSTNGSVIWLGKDAADTTWQVITRRTGTANKIDTGITVTDGQVLDLAIFSAPNSQAVTFYVRNPITGADLYVGTPITTNLPTNTSFLYPTAQIASTVGTTSKLLGVGQMYLEKDF
jgi:hypothetical protein